MVNAIKKLATDNQVTRATRFLSDLARTANAASPPLLDWINAIPKDSLKNLLASWRALHRNGNAVSQFIRRDRASLEWAYINAADLTITATNALYTNLAGRAIERAFVDPQGRLVVLTQSTTATRRVATLEKNVNNVMQSFLYSRAYNRGGQSGFPPLSANGLTPDYSGNAAWLFPVTGNQRNIVRITLAGHRRGTDGDFHRANQAAGFRNVVTPRGPNGERYTWHHLDDFDPKTGQCTMQLVNLDDHRASVPHTGSVKQWENYHEREYRN